MERPPSPKLTQVQMRWLYAGGLPRLDFSLWVVEEREAVRDVSNQVRSRVNVKSRQAVWPPVAHRVEALEVEFPGFEHACAYQHFLSLFSLPPERWVPSLGLG